MRFLVFYLSVFFWVLCSRSAAQYELKKKIEGKFEQVSSDNLGHIYLVNEKHNLLKMSLSGDTLFTFEDKAFPVYFCDASNGLKVLVFNEKQNNLQFLDKTLTPLGGPLLIDQLSIPLVSALGISRDNLFWIFDQNTQELKKFDVHSTQIFNSGSVIALTGFNIQPHYLREQQAKVYLVDSLQGVFQFDHLGTYLYHFQSVKAKKIAVRGDKMVFLKGQELYIYDTFLMETQKLQLNGAEGIKDFALDKSEIVVLTEKSVLIFRSEQKGINKDKK